MKNDDVKIIIEKLTSMELRQRKANITDVFEEKNWEYKIWAYKQKLDFGNTGIHHHEFESFPMLIF